MQQSKRNIRPNLYTQEQEGMTLPYQSIRCSSRPSSNTLSESLDQQSQQQVQGPHHQKALTKDHYSLIFTSIS
jgi:hypothetical protein